MAIRVAHAPPQRPAGWSSCGQLLQSLGWNTGEAQRACLRVEQNNTDQHDRVPMRVVRNALVSLLGRDLLGILVLASKPKPDQQVRAEPMISRR